MEQRAITKIVNRRVEDLHAARAVGSGGNLAVVREPGDDFILGKKGRGKTLGELKAAARGERPAGVKKK